MATGDLLTITGARRAGDHGVVTVEGASVTASAPTASPAPAGCLVLTVPSVLVGADGTSLILKEIL